METQGRPPLWTKSFVGIGLTNFFTFFSFQAMIPAIPLYLHSMQVDSIQVGVVFSAFSLSILISRPLAGLWVDWGGDRKCALLSTAFSFVAMVVYWFGESAMWFLVARFLHGGSVGFATVAFGVIVARLVPAARRGEGLGYFAMSVSLSFCLGPMVGAWLMSAYGFAPIVVVSASCVVLSFILILAMPFIALKHPAIKSRLSWKHFYEKRVLFPSILCFLTGLAFAAIVAFIALWGLELGLHNVGLFFAMNAIASFSIRPIAGRISDNMGYAWVVLPCALLNGLGLVIIWNATGLGALMLGGALTGAGGGAIYPILQAWTIDLVPMERRGAALSFFYNFFDIGVGIGVIGWGWLALVTGYGLMYGYASLTMLILLFIYIFYLIANRHQKQKLVRL